MNTFPELTFPLIVILVPFGLFVLFYLIWSAFNVYHLIRFGISGWGMSLLMTVYVSGTILLVVGSLTLLSRYDWSTRVNFTDFLLQPAQNSTIIPTL